MNKIASTSKKAAAAVTKVLTKTEKDLHKASKTAKTAVVNVLKKK